MPGVSSTITSTPVIISKERMLRPSRPMMRPFMSSKGMGTTESVLSTVSSPAKRWMARVMISLASRLAVAIAVSLISRTLRAATRRAPPSS